MRGILMTSVVSGALFFLLFWLREKFIAPRIPRWADAILFGAFFGASVVAAGWIGAALGWRRLSPEWPAFFAGGLLGGLVVGFYRWLADSRAPRKRANP